MRAHWALVLAAIGSVLAVGHADVARADPFERSPQQLTVEQFYADLRAGAYADAYSFFSAGYAAQNPYGQWVAGYSNTLLFTWSTWPTDDPTIIGVQLSAEDRVQGHQNFAGTWQLVPADASPGGWLLDGASIAPSGPFPSPLAADTDFFPFTGAWQRHGFVIGVDGGGHAVLDFRIYSWCSDDPTPPCDEIVGNTIFDGGHGAITFTGVVGNTAYGSFDDGGDVVLTRMPYDMATLTDIDGGRSVVLCGPHFTALAPPDLLASSPCGA